MIKERDIKVGMEVFFRRGNGYYNFFHFGWIVSETLLPMIEIDLISRRIWLFQPRSLVAENKKFRVSGEFIFKVSDYGKI